VKRNILLAYILAFCKNAWFWLGIWVFYYLKGTNYAGIGLIETVLIVTMTITEIPTGAIADIFGKKKTLFMSYLLLALGNFLMSASANFYILITSVFISAVGVSLGSGTLEALVYDSLKQEKREDLYNKNIANIYTIQLIAIAICGAGGGFLYKLNSGIPFLVTGLFYLLGGIVCLLLTEPKIDSVKYSVKSYLNQLSKGITQLLNAKEITWLLLSVGFVVVITDEMLNSVLGVEFGFGAEAMGVFWAGIFLVSAAANQLIPIINKNINEKLAIVFTGLVIGLSLVISPWLGLLAGGLSLLIRNSFQSIYYGLSSVSINKVTASKYRATTLSTFNMIKNLPYVLGAYFFGFLADKYSAKKTAFYLGIVLIILLLTSTASTTTTSASTTTRKTT
jgi:MFS family permease